MTANGGVRGQMPPESVCVSPSTARSMREEVAIENAQLAMLDAIDAQAYADECAKAASV